MKRFISIAFVGLVLGLAGFAQSAQAQTPIKLNAGFIAQWAAQEGGSALNYMGMSITGMVQDTTITGTQIGPASFPALLGTNLSNTVVYSFNFGVMTITYTFTYQFSVNKVTGEIFCTYTLTELGVGPATSTEDTGRNISMLGNTNGPVSTTTGVGPTNGPVTSPEPFNPVSINPPFLSIDPSSFGPPPDGYIYFGSIIFVPQKQN